MVKKLCYFLVLFSSLLLAVSCAKRQPVLNIQNKYVSSELTASKVKKCIELGGVSRGWQMSEVKPGLIHGVIDRRGHHAEIDIPYSSKGYSINYASSKNLMANGNMVHRNYNKWIKLLDESIQKYLRKERKVELLSN